ncbi:MAG: hypothetical protein Q7R95_06290 [bacterium]|nr:hypothetical protein [bacterium]
MKILYKIKWWFIDIKLFIKSKYQKLIYGFEFRDCWDLRHSHAKWILPRLKYLRNNFNGTPHKEGGDDFQFYSVSEWKDILDKIIFAFDFVLKEDDYLTACYPKDFNYNIGYVGGKSVFKDNRKPDYKLYNIACEKQQEGLILFAKHYDALWS